MTSVTNSTLAFYRRSQLHMGGLRASAESLQRQLATGERLERSSNDPVAASRLRSLDRLQTLGEINSANARRAGDDLQMVGNALESVANDIIRARELALWASSDTVSEKDRAAIATEIDGLRQRILSSVNTLDSDGASLFGGEASGVAYTQDAAGTITYVGGPTSSTIDLGQGQTIVRSFTGPEVFSFTTNGSGTDIFAHLATLSVALQGGSADPAQAARDSITGLDDALESVNRAQTITGSRVAWLDVVQDRQIDQSLSRSQQIADTGGVEFTSAIAELQQILTVLEVSQASFARVANLSLFDQI